MIRSTSLIPKCIPHIAAAFCLAASFTACIQPSTPSGNGDSGELDDYVEVQEAAWAHPGNALDMADLPSREGIAEALKKAGHTQFEFIGKSVIVEGDWVLHLSDFVDTSLRAESGLAKTAQRAYSLGPHNRVSRDKVYKVYVAPSLGNNWSQAADNAMRFWSTYGKFKFTRARSTDYWSDIAIVAARNIPPDVFARAPRPRAVSNPSRVVPGGYVQVNAVHHRNLGLDKASLVMIHEFGHCFGFAHTDARSDSQRIPGTPDNDRNSFMASNINLRSKLPTSGDFAAIRYMYP